MRYKCNEGVSSPHVLIWTILESIRNFMLFQEKSVQTIDFQRGFQFVVLGFHEQNGEGPSQNRKYMLENFQYNQNPLLWTRGSRLFLRKIKVVSKQYCFENIFCKPYIFFHSACKSACFRTYFLHFQNNFQSNIA